VGAVERPSIFRFEFQENPQKHVVLLNVCREEPDEFFSKLRNRVSHSARKEAFVFVHGFNVTFEAAAQRTAQLAYDLKFDGAPIFYSWPSQGGLLQYAVDETNVAWTVPHLKEFLTSVAQQSGAASVHLIAHSMGNRALTSALQTLSYEMKDQRPMFNEVVLTAPDIDADIFRRDIAPAIVKTAERVTLYASSNDEALALSKTVHGYPRAGESGDNMVIVDGVDTIDVSLVDTSLLGHSYYGSNHTVLADLLDLVNSRKAPNERQWLRPMQLGRLAYWAFIVETERLRTAVGGESPTR
jgi:esterase/lipase superfamily enzyme